VPIRSPNERREPRPGDTRAATGTTPAQAPTELERRLLAGNAAFARYAARQPAPAPTTAPTPTTAPAAKGDVVQDALTELRASADATDRNTAKAIDAGTMTVRYLEDLKVHPDSDALLDGWGYDKTKLIVRLCPNGEQRVLQRNAEGAAHDDCGKAWLFVAKTVTVARMRQLLVHETNHAMRVTEGPRPTQESFERYKDEFQAYWIAEFRGVADLDARAGQIRQHILRDYAAIAARYNTDNAFKALVDAHKRPDGNVLNSANWRAAEQAMAGPGADPTKLFAALSAMDPAERALVKANAGFMQRLRAELSHEDCVRAVKILDGGP
jgi:hypothetical protein